MRFLPLLFAVTLGAQTDSRLISTGRLIPDEGYSDQPYIAKTNDGAWLCVITTGPGVEGAGGQHVVTRRSMDQGKTWSAAVNVEPSDGPEASYAVLLKVPTGRVYVFYNHNTDNLREVIADKPTYKDGLNRRVDSLGHFVYKYSDDHGRTWSAQRYEVPQRNFEIDRQNPYQGKVKFFWTVGKSFITGNAGYVPLHKVGGFGEGFFTSSEGVLLRSDNILTEMDPAKLHWVTWPEGDVGLRTPPGGGPIAEEQSFSVLSDGSLFAVYRTIDGHPAHSYSRDGGRSWSTPEYMRFSDGSLMKHPRAANFAWRCENGKFLYWFHHHGGRFIREHPKRRTIAYEERNPVWLSGGIEADSPQGKVIRWSQPEIALYDDDVFIRMSYPDLVEDGGKYYLTETQKDIARVHEIDSTLLEGLWNHAQNNAVAPGGTLLNLASPPKLPDFLERSRRGDYGTEDRRAGITFDLRLHLKSLAPGQHLLDNRTPDGRGFAIVTAANGALEITLSDGRVESRWRSDAGALTAGKSHAATVIIDGGPKIILFVTDGKVNDGADERQYGWGRYNPNLKNVNGTAEWRVAKEVTQVRVYVRALRTSEAIGNQHATR